MTNMHLCAGWLCLYVWPARVVVIFGKHGAVLLCIQLPYIYGTACLSYVSKMCLSIAYGMRNLRFLLMDRHVYYGRLMALCVLVCAKLKCTCMTCMRVYTWCVRV